MTVVVGTTLRPDDAPLVEVCVSCTAMARIRADDVLFVLTNIDQAPTIEHVVNPHPRSAP